MKLKLLIACLAIALIVPGASMASNIGLCAAAKNGNAETVQALIDVGADVNCRCDNKRGHMPLMYAVWSGSAQTVKYLLEAGADPNLQDSVGWTPLHAAAQRDNIETLKDLLNYGADPLVKIKTGETAVDLAGGAGRAENVRLIASYINKPAAMAERKASADISRADVIVLKNGDILSGDVLTAEFPIDASYATLKFEFEEIDSVIYEGDQQNIESIVLKNGDKISGKVGPDSIRVKLQSGQEIEVDKDKVKQIKAKR
jgi:hypothetical protein